MEYLGKVWRNALQRYRLRLTHGSGQIMGFIIQTSIVFAILYFQPWVGNLADEAKLAGAGVIAVLVSAALSFLWNLIASPKDIYEKLKQDHDAAVHSMGWYADQAEAQDQLIALYKEGEDIYCGETSYEIWRDSMLEWNERVVVALRIAFEPNIVFKYQQAKGQFSRSKWLEIIDEDQPRRGEYNNLFSNWLKELEEIVKHRAPSGIDWVKIRELNANRIAPDSLKALKEKNGGKLPSR